MIGDIASVLSLLNDLVTRKSEINREYFENYIEPIWLAFTEIHEDYKESLHKYRNSLLSRENPIEILHQIKYDSCSTEDLRIRLVESMRGISSRKSIAKEKIIYDFASYILDYFDSTRQTNQANFKKPEEVKQAQNNQLVEKSREATKKQGLVHRIQEDIYINAKENICNTFRAEVFDSMKMQIQNFGSMGNQEIYRESVLVIQNTLERLQDCYRRAAEGYFLVRQELLN